MAKRSLLVLGVVFILFQVVASKSASQLSIASRESKTAPQNLPQCGFEGNSDFYGIGVRVGFYLTWLSGLIAFTLNPEESEGQADAQTIFLIANLISLIVFQVQNAASTNVVVPILLFYMFFGGSVIGVTSATASLNSWRTANRSTKVAILFRQAVVQATFMGMLIYSFYFWTKGFAKFKTFPEECEGTFVFPLARRVSLDKPSVGSVLALLLLVAIYILIWYISYKRLQRSFGPKTVASLPYSNLSQSIDEDAVQTPPWDQRQRPWTIAGGVLVTFVVIWSIAGIELTLRWNRVTGVNDILSTGQLIPFVMGIASLPSALWGVVEYVQDVKEDERKDSPLDVQSKFPQHTAYSPGYENQEFEMGMASAVHPSHGVNMSRMEIADPLLSDARRGT